MSKIIFRKMIKCQKFRFIPIFEINAFYDDNFPYKLIQSVLIDTKYQDQSFVHY